MKLNCKEETARTRQIQANIKVLDFYHKNHQAWVEGTDSLGNHAKFYYHAFLDFTNYLEKGDIIKKDSGSSIFVLTKGDIVYTFDWNCKTGGALVKTDSTKHF